MPTILDTPSLIDAHGAPPKQIAEHVGRVATGDTRVSIAVMRSPRGWSEPSQRAQFDEWTVVVTGDLHVESATGVDVIRAGQAVHVAPGETVRYSTPDTDAVYVAVCMPAFSPSSLTRLDPDHPRENDQQD